MQVRRHVDTAWHSAFALAFPFLGAPLRVIVRLQHDAEVPLAVTTTLAAKGAAARTVHVMPSKLG